MSTKQFTLHVTCALRFTSKYIIDNTCDLSRDMGDTQASNSKSDLQGHSRQWC